MLTSMISLFIESDADFDSIVTLLSKKFDVKDRTFESKKYGYISYSVKTPLVNYDLRFEMESSNGYLEVTLISAFTLRPDQNPEFFEIFEALCKEADPLIGQAGLGVFDASPAIQSGVHFRNPYLFLIDPTDEELRYDIHFFNDTKILAKTDHIKKMLPKTDLIRILKKYVEKLSISKKGGVTIIRSSSGDGFRSIATHYFLCKEVRKKGIDIPKGDVENLAEKIGEEKLKQALKEK